MGTTPKDSKCLFENPPSSIADPPLTTKASQKESKLIYQMLPFQNVRNNMLLLKITKPSSQTKANTNSLELPLAVTNSSELWVKKRSSLEGDNKSNDVAISHPWKRTKGICQKVHSAIIESFEEVKRIWTARTRLQILFESLSTKKRLS